jgi:hypothetical protein
VTGSTLSDGGSISVWVVCEECLLVLPQYRGHMDPMTVKMEANRSPSPSDEWSLLPRYTFTIKKKKVKLSLYQAMEAHRVVRR